MNDSRVVLLTALNLEYEAVRAKMTGTQVHWHHAGTRFETGRLGPEGCPVALGLVGKGNHPAAVLAERAIAEFSPAAVLFVGIAGALWPSIKLGDVVVASQVYAYHGGTSEDDGMKSRPRTWEISHRAGQIAQHLIRTEEWIKDKHGSKAHFGAIAAGEVVQDSQISKEADWIRQHYNDALAIEMEAAGVAQAGHLNRSLPVVVIRGISDRADGTKTDTDAQDWRRRAAANAADFATALAPQLADGDGIGDAGKKATVGNTFNNSATGNARVGVQAGIVHGGITVGRHQPPPGDLTSAIAQLRDLIKEAHRDGHLDRATYTAATAELDDASTNVSNRTRMLLALKRFSGLISDTAEIGTAAAAIIAGLQGLS
jgi:adenosylhomocysteine nucleosidase